MRKQDKIMGFALICVIIGFSLFTVYQGQKHQVEINELLNVNDGSGWGATITMSVYRYDTLLSEESHHNVITNALRSALRAHIGSVVTDLWKYIAIGTGTGGDADSTILETEYLRALGVYAEVGSYNFTVTFTWLAGNFSGQTITEYGLFNDPDTDDGVMFNYSDDFSRGPLLAADVLAVTINCQIGS